MIGLHNNSGRPALIFFASTKETLCIFQFLVRKSEFARLRGNCRKSAFSQRLRKASRENFSRAPGMFPKAHRFFSPNGGSICLYCATSCRRANAKGWIKQARRAVRCRWRAPPLAPCRRARHSGADDLASAGVRVTAGAVGCLRCVLCRKFLGEQRSRPDRSARRRRMDRR